MNVLRSASLLALASAALSAQGVVAYSNKPAGDYFLNGFLISPDQTFGYQFASSATGALTGFDVAINNYQASGPAAFTLRLYADANGTLGSLLGTYAGTTSGSPIPTTSGYDAVAAGGVGLTSGTSYWLVASSSESVYWNWTDGTTTQLATYSPNGTDFFYSPANAGAFSVNVASAVPGPAALGPFALGALATLRKRRRKA